MITVDDSEWPLVRVRFGDSISDPGWDEYLATLSRFPDRREKYVTITDARRAATPNASQRRRSGGRPVRNTLGFRPHYDVDRGIADMVSR